MRPSLILPLFGGLLLATLACARSLPAPDPIVSHVKPARDTLQPFASQDEFDALLARWKREAEQRTQAGRRHSASLSSAPLSSPPAPSAMAAAESLDSIQVTGSRLEADDAEASITNNQVQGVDEGDIVKKRGDHLIVLRRGRLFTVRIGGDTLTPASMVDAFAPGSDPAGTWYDEMLVGARTVVVIGFSYARGGTEIGLFDIDAAGGLTHRDTYHLRSNDYYSARNYASRLIGDTLVFYTPMRLDGDGGEVAYPAMRRWHRDAVPTDFRRILPANRVYRGDDDLDPRLGVALHTVTRCSLATRDMQCTSNAVLGPSGRVFHVAEDAVYVWTSRVHDGSTRSPSTVYRLPLDGSAPSALGTRGSPVDQMAFLQRDGHLNVLVAGAGGDGMRASARGAEELALLRVPLSAFGTTRARAPVDAYRPLPGVDGQLHNRFIGDWLVYGGGSAWNDDPRAPVAHALRYAAMSPVQTLPLAHDVERIDALASDAVLVGSRGDDLQFTSVALGARAMPASTYTQPNARQGDDRTHGFFYKPRDANEGIVGLPVVEGDDNAGVLYLRNASLRLSRMGRLDASNARRRDDACKASCVDWYGNARPIFVGDRVFALLGYELVEGRVDAQRIEERRRVDFSPRVGIAVAR